MYPERVKILDHPAVEAILTRMAFQIYEKNFLQTELTLLGLDARGSHLTHQLADRLERISPLRISRFAIKIDRNSASKVLGINMDGDLEQLTGKVVVLVDDVLYTGITLLNVVAITLQAEPQQIQVAALIDRGHRLAPIATDYVGKELATTLHQHIQVEIDPETGLTEVFLR